MSAHTRATRPDPATGVAPARVPLREATWVWLRIAALSFGGPAGQIAVMHRIVVEEKRWIGESRFLHALNFCMLLPGPEAQQLATYLGWLMHGVIGGVIAGVLFILPGALAIMLLSWVFVLYGELDWIQALFFGLRAAVLAIVLDALLRIARRALTTSILRVLAVAAFVGLFVFALPFPLVVLGAGGIGYLAGRAGTPGLVATVAGPDEGGKAIAFAAPRRRTLLAAMLCLGLWLVPVVTIVAILGPEHVYARIATFFSAMAMVTFGGAYAVLTYVAQQAVETYAWLTPREMLAGLGLAETTPGPLIMVLQFVGFLGAYRDPGTLSPLLAGTLGGLLATWVTFAPCFAWIFLGAPFMERLRHDVAVATALRAITAAVVGVIANLAVWFGLHVLIRDRTAPGGGEPTLPRSVLDGLDVAALLLVVLAMVCVFRLRLGLFATLALTATGGLALRAAGVLTGSG